jgi:hypothetical protein
MQPLLKLIKWLTQAEYGNASKRTQTNKNATRGITEKQLATLHAWVTCSQLLKQTSDDRVLATEPVNTLHV